MHVHVVGAAEAAVVAEVEASFARGPVATSAKVLRPGAQHFVMWQTLGSNSIRLQPNKSNSVVWLNKAWALTSELDPSSTSRGPDRTWTCR